MVKCVLGAQVTVKFICDAANPSRIPDFFFKDGMGSDVM